ncbi:MAG TPA: NAD(P)H-hydrate dehydratase [Nevskiaceae bacterium]|nr:NAD(P)H-hydrate dehydratase [Nevskiaceae bacterium]
MGRADRTPTVEPIGPAVLRRLPLPALPTDGSKEDRGRVLVIGGHREVPGSVLLAATAALRAGAGKVQLALPASAAVALAVAMPEGRVLGLEEADDGGLAGTVTDPLVELARRADAICVGPGMLEKPPARALLDLLLKLDLDARWVVDGVAVCALREEDALLGRLRGRAVLTPHAGEMAALLGITREAVENDFEGTAYDFSRRHGVVVALKGVETVIADAESPVYRNRRGNAGLATAGSGDVLAGMVAGLAARGATPLTAAVWGVHGHALAGEQLARSTGPVGYLARDLLPVIPGILARAAPRASRVAGRRGGRR